MDLLRLAEAADALAGIGDCIRRWSGHFVELAERIVELVILVKVSVAALVGRVYV